MKKIIKKILIIFILFVALVIHNQNFTYATEENLTTIASGNCTDTITWSLDNNGVLTISGSGGMDTTSSTTSPWSEYKDQVKSVVFSGEITAIGAHMFDSHSNIETITIPETVDDIGIRAFAECTNLKEVIFPKNMKRIREVSFYKCTSLEEVVIPETSILYIYDYAFNECTSLKMITLDTMYSSIEDSELVFPESTIICGYRPTNTFYYARSYGRTFKNLQTGEVSQETFTNDMYLNAMPTENIEALGITEHGNRSLRDNAIVGYNTTFANEKDETNETYIKMKNKVEELTAGCTTERDKAYEITNWVVQNMTYKYAYGCLANAQSVYTVFERLTGNCESYTMLTNYMLYLAGIPTATVSNFKHEWSMAYVDGKWIYIDSTWYRFDASPNKAAEVSFAYQGLIYTINDPTEGPYICEIAKPTSEIENLTTFTIPNNSYTKGIYKTAFPNSIELRTNVNNTIGVDYIKTYRTCIGTHNGEIVGQVNHTYEKTTIQNENGTYKEVNACTNCGDETYLLGDVNGDGKINITDVAKVNARAKWLISFNTDEFNRADVNGDGKINVTDVAKINLYAKGLISTFE